MISQHDVTQLVTHLSLSYIGEGSKGHRAYDPPLPQLRGYRVYIS